MWSKRELRQSTTTLGFLGAEESVVAAVVAVA